MQIKLSSYKKAFGLEKLISNNPEETWQTDGSLPHYIEVTFYKKVFITHIQVTLSYREDASYTPREIEVRYGIFHGNTQLALRTCLNEPEGIITLIINQECFMLLFIIRSNHCNGKDSKIRRFNVFSGEDELKMGMLYY